MGRLLIFFFPILLVLGCSTDCEKLVKRACRGGVLAHTQCSHARDLARQADPDAQKSCRTILSTVNLLLGE